jgi:hypothetical protein
VNPNQRYHSKKHKDKRAVFLKALHERKLFYREYLFTNVFNEEFDSCKRDKIKLEKFIKISNRECYLTVCSNAYRYFFLAICCKTKEHFLISLYKKKMKKLLHNYDNSLRKIAHLLRIKNGHMFIKNLDFILKDRLNISDCMPLSYRLHKSRSRSGHNRSEPSERHEQSVDDRKPPMNNSMTEMVKLNDNTVVYEDKNSLPRVR